MNVTQQNKKKFSQWIMVITAIFILIFLGKQNIDWFSDLLSRVGSITMPIIIGFAIAVILNVPMRFLEVNLWKNAKSRFLSKARRPVAFALSLIFIVGILVGAIVIILPTLIETLSVLVQSAIEMIERFNSMDESDISEWPFGEILLEINWNGLLDSFKSWLEEQAHTIVNAVFGTATSFVVAIIDLFISVAFAFYLLFSKEKLKAGFKRLVKVWLPEKKADWLLHALSVANVNFRGFISGQFIEAVILGLLCFIGMMIFGFPYAAMISTFIGVTALIPVIGCYLGGGIGAFMILTVDPIQAIWFVVYIIVLQQIEGNLIYPKVMGNSVNLSAMWILTAVTIGGGIAGAAGILLSVPLLSTAFTLFAEATDKREASLSAKSDDEPYADKSTNNTAEQEEIKDPPSLSFEITEEENTTKRKDKEKKISKKGKKTK